MNLLPALAPTSHSNIADLFTKPLSRHQFTTMTLVGDILPTPLPTTSVVTATVATAPTVASASNSVPTPSSVGPTIAPTLLLDTGASFPLTPFNSDFLSQAPYGLIRSSASVLPYSKGTSIASTPVDPYTLITGEDTTFSVDLSSTDSNSVFDFVTAFGPTEFHEFGTATLVFYYSGLTLIYISVEPDLDRFDWLHWIPLPRLILSESYFHIFGLDYLQVFALFHLIPIWIALVSALIQSE